MSVCFWVCLCDFLWLCLTVDITVFCCCVLLVFVVCSIIVMITRISVCYLRANMIRLCSASCWFKRTWQSVERSVCVCLIARVGEREREREREKFNDSKDGSEEKCLWALKKKKKKEATSKGKRKRDERWRWQSVNNPIGGLWKYDELKLRRLGREPWSSGYGWWLMFQRSWVRILAPYTGWTWHFSHWFVVKIVIVLVWKDWK